MNQPAYRIVYTALKEQIEKKVYEVGEVLPTEPELEKTFGFSRTTIRKAIDMLAREGYISVRQGSGTRVLSRKAVQNLNAFSSISQSFASKGIQLGLKRCFLEICPADRKLAALLQVEEGESLVVIHRIKTVNEKPVCIMKNYIPKSLLPHLDLNESIPFLYEFLKEKYGIEYTGSKDIISASSAGFEEACLLEVEPKEPLLHVQRVCFSGQKPLEVDLVDMIADAYEYEVYLGEKI